MPTPRRSKPIGPTGQNIARNLNHLRKERKMSAVHLAKQMSHCGIPLPEEAVYRIERLTRQTTPDELTALANIFGVSAQDLMAEPVTCCGHHCQRNGDAP